MRYHFVMSVIVLDIRLVLQYAVLGPFSSSWYEFFEMCRNVGL